MVAVLFARQDSVYKSLAGCDVFDIDRDARTWPGGCQVVAHPPCRAWGRLRAFAKPRPDEKQLAFFAVNQVRKFGGVLEHPEASTLWREASLPKIGERDQWNGYTLPISQKWWGHRAEKKTWLYIVGVEPVDLPVMPLVLGEASHVVGLYSGRDKSNCRPAISKAEREHTPAELAVWLVEVAKRCKVKNALRQ